MGLIICSCNVVQTDAANAEVQKQEYLIEYSNYATRNVLCEEYNAALTTNNDMVVAELSQEGAEHIAEMQGVECVEENIVFTASGDEVPGEAIQWNLEAIGMPEAYPGNLDDVRVAIMDSGVVVDYDIPVEEHINLVTDEQVAVQYEDITGHGTSVASIVAAQSNDVGITGINPSAKLYSVKILDQDNKAGLDRVISGIRWCINNDINIINMSFGTTSYSPLLEQVVKEAYNAGILMIAAAGNNGDRVEYPAAFPEVIAVGATTPAGDISDASVKGDEVELAAPGEKVLASGVFSSYVAVEGTSIAASHVTGIASLLWGLDSSKSSDFIRQLMDCSARKLDNAIGSGNGQVDLSYAMSIYDDFADAYVQNEMEAPYSIFENTAEVNTYSDAEVQASWNKAAHESLVASVSTSAAANIMKKTAGLVDSNDVLSANKRFHGGGNYVLDLKYLYRLAMNLYNNAGKASVSLQDILDMSMISSSVLTYYEEEGLTRLEDDMREVLQGKDKQGDKDYGLRVYVLGTDASRTSAAYLVMGIACHLASDTFAHRTVISTTAFENNTISDIQPYMSSGKYSKLKTNVKNHIVEFRDLKHYANSESNLSTIRSKFEDNTSFFSSRYNQGATYAIRNLYNCFMNGTNFAHGTTIIEKVFASSSIALKLNNLNMYAKADNESNSAISGKSTDNYRYDSTTYSEKKASDYDHDDYKYSDGNSIHGSNPPRYNA